MEKKFIIINAVNGHHALPVDLIEYVTPLTGEKNKSNVALINCKTSFNSTDTVEVIYNKIIENNK